MLVIWHAITCASIAAELNIGDRAPAIDAVMWLKGEPVTEFKGGHVYVVEFWATWCGPCKANIPHLTSLARKYRGRATVVGVSVREQEKNEGSASVVRRFVDYMGDRMDYTIAMDNPHRNTVFDAWMAAAEMQGIPTAFVVDKSGAVAWIGHPRPTDHALEDAIIAALEDRKAKSERSEAELIREAQARGRAANKRFQSEAIERQDYQALRKKAAELAQSPEAIYRIDAVWMDFVATLFLEPERAEREIRDGGLSKSDRHMRTYLAVTTRGVSRELVRAAVDVLTAKVNDGVRDYEDVEDLRQLAGALRAHGDTPKAIEMIDRALALLEQWQKGLGAQRDTLLLAREEYLNSGATK